MLPGHWNSITYETEKVPVKIEHMVTVNFRNVHIGEKSLILGTYLRSTTSVIRITENHRKLSPFLSSNFNGFNL